MGCQRVEPPGPGQESIWDYPHPPSLEDSDGRIKLVFGRGTLAYTSHAKRVLETRDPPVYYVPPEDVRMEHPSLAEGTSFCEWKGVARYYDIETGERKGCQAAWFYPDPVPAYAGLKEYIAFYPSLMDAYWVDGEKVQPQAGNFYGGWITPDIVGPFNGDPDTWGWQDLVTDLQRLRKEYTRAGLAEADADPDPVEQFRKWFGEALAANLHEPNAMILASATLDGRTSARVVLLKGYDERGFLFYTNYEARKSRELEENPRCTLVFYWGELERQVRIEGRAKHISGEESDEYYRSRPRGSRLSAWASAQSRPVEDRGILEKRLRELEAKYEGREIPRPPFWGGYRVEPGAVEFWQGRENRLHDRLLYSRLDSGGWRIERLQPQSTLDR